MYTCTQACHSGRYGAEFQLNTITELVTYDIQRTPNIYVGSAITELSIAYCCVQYLKIVTAYAKDKW